MRNLGFSFGRTPENQDEEYRELERKLLEKAKNETVFAIPAIQDQSPTIISERKYWRIPNVVYKKGVYIVDLAKSLLEVDDNHISSPETWSKYRTIAEPLGKFYPADMPLHHAVFTALYRQRKQPGAEEAREFLERKMKQNWLTTLTNILYQPFGKDRITHNFRTPQKYEIEEDLLEPTGITNNKITNSSQNPILSTILGETNINEINSVYQWISKKPFAIIKMNPRPKTPKNAIVNFYSEDQKTHLNCTGLSLDVGSSLGIRIVKKEETDNDEKKFGTSIQ